MIHRWSRWLALRRRSDEIFMATTSLLLSVVRRRPVPSLQIINMLLSKKVLCPYVYRDGREGHVKNWHFQKTYTVLLRYNFSRMVMKKMYKDMRSSKKMTALGEGHYLQHISASKTSDLPTPVINDRSLRNLIVFTSNTYELIYTEIHHATTGHLNTTPKSKWVWFYVAF